MRVAVVGAGVVGLAVTYELVRGGHDVQCFEAAIPMAARSTGSTRIFRFAHATSGLVTWAERARRGWDAWSSAAGQPLVGREGLVVSGDVEAFAAAMATAGVAHRLTEQPPRLPASAPAGPFLLDPNAGVVRAAETGAFLLVAVADRVVRAAVTGLAVHDGRAVVVTGSGSQPFDSVVLAAGTGTPALAADVGVELPAALVHHARFGFPLRDVRAEFPCWMDRSGRWRRGFTTYGQLAGPGRWAVGAELPQGEPNWELGREEVVRRERELVSAYVAEHVTGAVPEVVETIYCAYPPGLGDGLTVERSGPVLVVWGDNLFKFAPVIGAVLARAAVEGVLPEELETVRHR